MVFCLYKVLLAVIGQNFAPDLLHQVGGGGRGGGAGGRGRGGGVRNLCGAGLFMFIAKYITGSNKKHTPDRTWISRGP